MALNIDDPETDRLARALADATGESIEAAVKTAIEQRLTRESSASDPALFDDLLEISKGAAALEWKSPDKSSVELLGDLYGEDGLPARW